jgi:SAM-dependent methyltransferase
MVYNQRFYDTYKGQSAHSAAQIVPFLVELLGPASVVDFGCGVGTWLSQFRECGIEDTLGLDGAWVDKANLQIPKENFNVADLSGEIQLGRRFDLAISLEVAEHIPEKSAREFIKNLVVAAPFVVFSAAIPLQGGDNHINEQWPDYWYKHFIALGYECFDVIRARFWHRTDIAYYYVQNMIVYAASNADPAIRKKLTELPGQLPIMDGPLSIVRHDKFFATASMESLSLKQWIRGGPGAVLGAIKRRL